MATMISGAAVMDGAFLLIAANEPCPQPQTREHLAAIEILGLKNVIVLQNKIDLVKRHVALAQYHQIESFLTGTIAQKSPIIPISAQHKYNIDVVVEYLVERCPCRLATSWPRP